MSLMAEIQSNVKRGGTVCQMSAVEEALDKRDLAELHAALKDKTVTAAAIFRALKGRGFTVNEEGVAKHRRGDCRCGR